MAEFSGIDKHNCLHYHGATMENEKLKRKSAFLFNIIIAGVVVNILAFFTTTLVFSSAKEKLSTSGLETSDPAAFQASMSALQNKAMLGYGLGFVALVICVVFALKRLKVTKLLQKAEQELLDDLDVR
jgi:flagellar basal body-associated protein FliL